jgi:K+-transporting ATPase A subunit
LGTNGGGFFGANSAHPLENPNYVTNMTEMVTQMIIPFALVFALGFILNKKIVMGHIYRDDRWFSSAYRSEYS